MLESGIKRCVLQSLVGYKKVYLPDKEQINIGRCLLTGIKDKNISRTQLTCVADYGNEVVTVLLHGRNYSTWNGYLMPRNAECVCKNGDILELICGNYRYKICFEADAPSPVTIVNNHINDDKPLTSYAASVSPTPMPPIGKSTTDSWESVDKNSLLIYTSKDVESRKKIAAFDMDGTIIQTKSGARFPKTYDDWQLSFSNTKQKIFEMYRDNYKIVFFTNQAGISRNKVKVPDFKKKIAAIVATLGVPVQAFVATGISRYRKPCPGMWETLTAYKNDNLDIDVASSVYVGDAAGRPKNWALKKPKDHSIADRLFAINIGIRFLTPEEFFLKAKPAPFEMPVFNPKNLPIGKTIPLSKEQEIILMAGGQGSGKSFYCKNHIVPHGYEYINRDNVGTWQKCVQMLEDAAKRQLSVVVDNTNGTKEARKRYLDIARQHNIPCRCFCMKTTVKHCFHNNKFRSLTDKTHIMVGDPIIYSFFKNYEAPDVGEGFSEIVHVDFVPSFKDAEEEMLYKMYLMES